MCVCRCIVICVQVLTSGRFRHSEYENRLLGINEVGIIFLDKLSRVSVCMCYSCTNDYQLKINLGLLVC